MAAGSERSGPSPMPPCTAFGFHRVRLYAALCFCVMVGLFVRSAYGQQAQIFLGDTKVENLSDRSPSGVARAFPVQAVATGQVSSLSVYLDRWNRASTVSVGVYADSNGHPQGLLSSAVIANAVNGQWNSVAMPPLQVTSGTTYWLALLGVDRAVRFRDRIGNCYSEVGPKPTSARCPRPGRRDRAGRLVLFRCSKVGV